MINKKVVVNKETKEFQEKSSDDENKNYNKKTKAIKVIGEVRKFV